MNKKTFSDWCNEAAVMEIEGRAFIDGALRHAHSERTFACVSPIDGRVLAQVADCGDADVDAAVAAARRAFNTQVWAGMNPRDRKAVLLRWAALMREHLEELALLETLDSGKPISDTTAIDVPAAAHCVEWYAEAIDKMSGEVVSTDHHLVGLVTREPVGVVAAVVPWNFPLLMAAWKFAPALAVGNSVVLKPSEKSPLSAICIARLAHEAGLPPGVLASCRVAPSRAGCSRYTTTSTASRSPARREPAGRSWRARRNPT
jgi:4-(gamma-glutamylamino)butanal dehydrogenase